MTGLTDDDRQLITRARELADLKGSAAICGYTGASDFEVAYPAALGTAQELLWQLALLAERLSEG